ncbi:hypothetical protein NLI96_g7611 [Meripilus lineatus]|uniref:Uncharacterized protein n=1 Tax=Meripilus lineatus TaxID=2056292 RepID=A0AAD5YH10_9APHY|nr:hypothetical protein NLI96_g7611 [Physisporinus lineatus]
MNNTGVLLVNRSIQAPVWTPRILASVRTVSLDHPQVNTLSPQALNHPNALASSTFPPQALHHVLLQNLLYCSHPRRIASLAFAGPIAEPAELEARQTNALSSIQSLQSTVSPLVTQLNQAATSRKDPTAVVNQIQAAFQDATQSLNGATLAKTNNAAAIDASVIVIADIVVALGRFAFIDVDLTAKVDAFVSAFVSAVDKTSPGIGAKIGAAIPAIDVNLFVVLNLILSVKVLVLVDILGIIIL